MTISHLFWLILGAATLFSMTASAQEPCPATPEKYRNVDFGYVRFAIEEGCKYTLTQNEQLFVAGIAQTLSSRCKLPRDRDGRAMVERFTRVSTLALSYPRPAGPIHEAITSIAGGTAAFAAGKSLAEDIRCKGPEAALLSRGIVLYLKRTSGRSRFVAGCVEFYKGRYNEKQCICIAENLRAVLPDVDQRYFDRDLIRQSIHHSPFIALPLMFSCGVDNY